MASAGIHNRPNLEDAHRLLVGGVQFAPKTKMAAVMTAIQHAMTDALQDALAQDGYVEVVVRGERIRYSFDHTTSNWQRVI